MEETKDKNTGKRGAKRRGMELGEGFLQQRLLT